MINDGQFVKSPGGGVSAVATTMYNAAFFAGVKPVEHGAHSFYIERYPEGREATVAWGTLDLRWINDSGHPLYIQARSTDTSLTISSSGRRSTTRYVRPRGRAPTSHRPGSAPAAARPARSRRLWKASTSPSVGPSSRAARKSGTRTSRPTTRRATRSPAPRRALRRPHLEPPPEPRRVPPREPPPQPRGPPRPRPPPPRAASGLRPRATPTDVTGGPGVTIRTLTVHVGGRGRPEVLQLGS